MSTTEDRSNGSQLSDLEASPAERERRWQAAWDASGLHRPSSDPAAGEPAYVLEMWPYPSGDLHMGHVRNYTIGDVFARYWRLTGRNVLHPMGWDSFGLPAENQAIKEGVPPQVRTPANIERMRAQCERLGLSYDWSREMAAHEPDYYRWNQWLFLALYERDLIYQRQSEVHFCPGCQTVLANEQVLADGHCWRGHAGVTRRRIAEWAFRLTRFADELLAGLDDLSGWPSRVVEQQRHWLGKSEGVRLRFALAPTGNETAEMGFEVFTTRIDTVAGCTALVLAPEHPLALDVCLPAHRPAALAMREKLAGQDAATRLAGQAQKEGVFTGAFAINPLTDARVPIWLANFVLADYGTGALMAVPAHDERDFAFAKAVGLDIVQAIASPLAPPGEAASWAAPFGGEGTVLGPPSVCGLPSAEARWALAEAIEARGLGGSQVQWRVRDWGFSRQRYWGTPIPIIYCDEHGAVPVPIEELPVRLPDDAEAALRAGGGTPLSKLADFVATSCPRCGKSARREVDTMDTFVDSAWYFARFLHPGLKDAPIDTELAKAWLPVDLYVGGPEHAVLHLLYFRFFTRALHALGLVPVEEPVRRLLTQGMVSAPSVRCPSHGYQKPPPAGDWPTGEQTPPCGSCGQPTRVAVEKMSKSKLNGIDPLALIELYGADTVRLYTLFAAPPEKDLEWNAQGVEGQARFVARLGRLATSLRAACAEATAPPPPPTARAPSAIRSLLHQTLAKVDNEYAERNHFNTAIASLMELTNALFAAGWHKRPPQDRLLAREVLQILAQMLSPLAPHTAEELWQAGGGQGLCAASRWPKPDLAACATEQATYAVQIMGRLRSQLEVPADADKASVIAAARADEKVQKYLADHDIAKVIFVPGRLLNFVLTKS